MKGIISLEKQVTFIKNIMYQLKQIIKFIIVTSENKINGEYMK